MQLTVQPCLQRLRHRILESGRMPGAGVSGPPNCSCMGRERTSSNLNQNKLFFVFLGFFLLLGFLMFCFVLPENIQIQLPVAQISSVYCIVLSVGDTAVNKGFYILLWTILFPSGDIGGPEYIQEEITIKGEKAEKDDRKSKQKRKLKFKK